MRASVSDRRRLRRISKFTRLEGERLHLAGHGCVCDETANRLEGVQKWAKEDFAARRPRAAAAAFSSLDGRGSSCARASREPFVVAARARSICRAYPICVPVPQAHASSLSHLVAAKHEADMTNDSAGALRSAACGAVAGVSGTLVGYPLDALKNRLQSGASTGLLASLRDIHRQRGLYRGVGAPLVSQTLLNTTSFAVYAHTRHLCGLPPLGSAEALLPNTDGWWLSRVSLAGALVAAPVTIVSTPAELLKIQQQFDPLLRHGTLAALRTVVKAHGVAALSRGMSVNFVRESVFLSVYFTSYEVLRERLKDQQHAVAAAAAGGCSGALAWFVSYPLDTLKTCVQRSTLAAPAPSALACARAVIHARGVRGLYAGSTPTVLRALLVSSTRFASFELALGAIGGA